MKANKNSEECFIQVLVNKKPLFWIAHSIAYQSPNENTNNESGVEPELNFLPYKIILSFLTVTVGPAEHLILKIWKFRRGIVRQEI